MHANVQPIQSRGMQLKRQKEDEKEEEGGKNKGYNSIEVQSPWKEENDYSNNLLVMIGDFRESVKAKLIK